VQRLKEHRITLARILKDDRLRGDTRFIAQLGAMYLDAEPRKVKRGDLPLTQQEIDEARNEKNFIRDLMYAQYIDKRGMKKNTDVEDDSPTAKIDTEATAIQRAALNDILGRG